MQGKASPRRVKVAGHRGIYRRPSGTYEICFQGSDGRTKWETVPGGLEDAIAARATVVVRKHGGEKIVNSQTLFAAIASEWLSSST